MTTVRTAFARLMATGVISAGWYSVLTGLAMLVAASLLGSALGSDTAAPVVAVALGITGVWQLERGLRAEFQRRRAE